MKPTSKVNCIFFGLGFLVLLTIYSCKENTAKITDLKPERVYKYFDVTDTSNSLKKEYFEKMKSKKFILQRYELCKDALRDTLYEWYYPYIESFDMTDSLIRIDFTLITSGCMEFMGDYNISKDTLFFEYEQVNTEGCSCIVQYKYRLKIFDIKNKFKYIKITKKNSS